MANFGQQIGTQMASAAGTGAAASAGGEVMSWLGELIMGNRRRKKQVEQQQKLTGIQIDANQQLAEHGLGLQKEMFDYTAAYNTPVQQRKRIEAAGLNPALMLGMMGGQGGTTGGQTTSGAGGGQAANEAEKEMAATQKMGMGLQMAMQKAQIENIQADTKEKEATAEKTSGVETEYLKKSIEDITASIENKKVQRDGMLLDNDFKILQNIVSDNTTEERINEIKYRSQSARETFLELYRNNEIGDAVKQNIIDSYKLNVENLVSDIIVKNSQSQVNRETAKKITQDVINSIEELQLKGKEVDIKEIEAEFKKAHPTISQSGGRFIQGAVSIVNDLFKPIDKIINGNKYY